jgi:hypothetical protein
MKNPRRKKNSPSSVPATPTSSIPPELQELVDKGRGYLDEVVVRLPFYEPNSASLDLSVGDLAENIMVVGSIGSGKSTTAMNRAIEGALRFHADNPAEKIGILIIDFKGDDTVSKVRHLARLAGREADLVVVDGKSASRISMFSKVREFDQIPDLVAKLASLAGMEKNNSFYESHRRTMLSTFLVALLATYKSLPLLDTLQALQSFILRQTRRRDIERVTLNHLLNEDLTPNLPDSLRLLLANADSQLDAWKNLDEKTASNTAASINNMLAPLFEMDVLDYIGGGLGEDTPNLIDMSQIIDEGKIVILSIPSGDKPQLATMLGGFIKADFYAAVSRRNPAPESRERLVLMVLDEYPLVATGMEPQFGDIPMLQTGRSRRMGVIAATQGLTSLALRLGADQMRGVMLNFLTQIYLRSNDPATDDYAARLFGTHTLPPPRRPVHRGPEAAWSQGTTEPQERPAPVAPAPQPICPPGRLASIEPFQAFIKTNRGVFSPEPAWLVPLFIPVPALDKPHKTPTRHRRIAVLGQAWADLEELHAAPQQPNTDSTLPF